MKSKFLLKTAAFFTLLAFTTQILFADVPRITFVTPQGEIPFRLDSSLIPSNLGKITEISGDSPSVILIQDPHGHYEGQKNIQKILELFYEKTKVRTMFVEGGVGALDRNLLRFFEDEKRNQKALD